MGMASWVPKPLATRLGEGQLLLAKDVNSLFIDADGNALDKRQVPWPLAPDTLAYSYPYMLALQPPAKGTLEVRNPDTLNLLQTIALPNASFLHVPQPNISLAHQGKGFLVASDRCIWRMAGQSYETQLDHLTAAARYDEALSLLAMLEDTLLQDKDGRVREIKMLKAEALFHDNKWADAMDLFIDAKAPPERVIALYPRAVAGDLSHEESVKGDSSVVDEDELESERPADDSDEIKKVSRESTFNPAATIGRSVMGRLVGGHKKADSDAASIRSEAAETASIRPAKKVTETTQPDRQVDFNNALRALQSYLAQCRVQIKRYIDTDGNLKEPLPEPTDSQQEPLAPPFHYFIQDTASDLDWVAKLLHVAQLVDTTLFRAYMLTKSTLAGSLFRLPNFCEPDVVQEKLYETGRYADLIDFLHGKKLHRQALELLSKFGKNEADEEVAPALQGPQRTVGYLQQLPPEMIDLILEFAEWPLRVDPGLGMDVFLADTQNAEELPRHQVLEFLEKLDLKLAVKYLEHVIEELNDLTPDFHQKLVDLFLERLRTGTFEDDEEKRLWRERLQTFLKTSSNYNNYRVFKQLSPDGKSPSHGVATSKTNQCRSRLLRIPRHRPVQDGPAQTSAADLRLPAQRLRQSRRVSPSHFLVFAVSNLKKVLQHNLPLHRCPYLGETPPRHPRTLHLPHPPLPLPLAAPTPPRKLAPRPRPPLQTRRPPPRKHNPRPRPRQPPRARPGVLLPRPHPRRQFRPQLGPHRRASAWRREGCRRNEPDPRRWIRKGPTPPRRAE